MVRALLYAAAAACLLASPLYGQKRNPIEVTRDGAVSGVFENAPLGDVLKSLSDRFPLDIRGPYSSSDPVSASFSGLTLDEALKRLLRGYNYVLMDGGASERRVLIFMSKSTRTPYAERPSSSSPTPVEAPAPVQATQSPATAAPALPPPPAAATSVGMPAPPPLPGAGAPAQVAAPAPSARQAPSPIQDARGGPEPTHVPGHGQDMKIGQPAPTLQRERPGQSEGQGAETATPPVPPGVIPGDQPANTGVTSPFSTRPSLP